MISPSTIDPLQLPSVALTDRKQLPQTPCIYFAIDAEDAVQYIGRSVNPRQRWQNHHRQAQLIGCWIAYMQCDEALLDEVETALIEWFSPALNGRSDTGKCRPTSQCVIRWRLHEALAERRIKGVDLAEALGVDPNSISRLRQRKTMPRLSPETLGGICEFLNCQPGDLLVYEPDPALPDPP